MVELSDSSCRVRNHPPWNVASPKAAASSTAPMGVACEQLDSIVGWHVALKYGYGAVYILPHRYIHIMTCPTVDEARKFPFQTTEARSDHLTVPHQLQELPVGYMYRSSAGYLAR